MYGGNHYPNTQTVLNFQVKFYEASKQGKWSAIRQRSLLAVQSDETYKVSQPHVYVTYMT